MNLGVRYLGPGYCCLVSLLHSGGAIGAIAKPDTGIDPLFLTLSYYYTPHHQRIMDTERIDGGNLFLAMQGCPFDNVSQQTHLLLASLLCTAMTLESITRFVD